MAKYKSIHTGPQIDSGVSRALNPDTVPTAGSSNLMTSGGTKSAITHDIANIVATGTTNTTGATIASGTYFYLNGALVRAKANIAVNATFTNGTNYEAVTAGGLNDLKAVLSDALSWTILQSSVAGNSSAQYPSTANEMLVEVSINNSLTYVYSFLIPANSPSQYYFSGYYVNASDCGSAIVKVNRSTRTISIDTITSNGNVVTLSNAKFTVYYR